MRSDRLGRREVITLIGGVAASSLLRPMAARALPAERMRRIGFLGGGAALQQPIYDGFLHGMRDLGYREGKDIVIEWRLADGRYERFAALAAEMVRLKVEVIVLSTTAALRPTQQATSAIPIVMGYSTDPVDNGFVASLARPGGNVTGLASSLDDIVPKQVELLASAVPHLSRIGLLTNPRNPSHAPVLRSAQAATRQASLALVVVEAQTPGDIAALPATLPKERVDAVIAIADAFLMSQRRQLAELMLQARLPALFASREYAREGGLMSYGESLFDFYKRSANYVDKILKGAKPADLPIEQPTLFKLVINRKTADAIGVTIPPQLYIFADEVIE